MRTVIEILAETYVELNKLNASPGQSCHMLAESLEFIQKEIRYVVRHLAETDEGPAEYQLRPNTMVNTFNSTGG